MRERQIQTTHPTVHAGSRLKSTMCGKVLSYMPAFQPYRGKPAVRNDREGRGNVGIIRSPIRASTLPDHSRPQFSESMISLLRLTQRLRSANSANLQSRRESDDPSLNWRGARLDADQARR